MNRQDIAMKPKTMRDKISVVSMDVSRTRPRPIVERMT